MILYTNKFMYFNNYISKYTLINYTKVKAKIKKYMNDKIRMLIKNRLMHLYW